MRRMQSGLSMSGFLMTLCLVIFFLYCGMKIVPMYIEFYSVKSALKGIASQSDQATASKDQIRVFFDRRLNMSYAEYVRSQKDALKFERNNNGRMMVVDYERREPLFLNLDVVGKFHAEQLLPGGGGAD